MKNNGAIIFLISLLVIIALALVGFMIMVMNGSYKGFKIFKQEKNILLVDETYENKFNKISITNTSSDIFIKKSNSDNYRVVIYGKKDSAEVNVNGDELIIKNNKKNVCIGFCFNIEKARIEVYMPSNYAKDIAIKSTSGDLEMDDFKDLNLEMVSTSGDLTIGNIDSADITVTSGDIEIRDINTLKIDSRSGDIDVNRVNNMINIKNTSGDISINTVNIKKDSLIDSRSGDVKINSSNEIYYDASAKSGDIKINNNYRKAECEFRINTTSGDITVNN